MRGERCRRLGTDRCARRKGDVDLFDTLHRRDSFVVELTKHEEVRVERVDLANEPGHGPGAGRRQQRESVADADTEAVRRVGIKGDLVRRAGCATGVDLDEPGEHRRLKIEIHELDIATLGGITDGPVAVQRALPGRTLRQQSSEFLIGEHAQGCAGARIASVAHLDTQIAGTEVALVLLVWRHGLGTANHARDRHCKHRDSDQQGDEHGAAGTATHLTTRQTRGKPPPRHPRQLGRPERWRHRMFDRGGVEDGHDVAPDSSAALASSTTRPSRKNTTRSAHEANRNSCVTNTTAVPRAAGRPASNSMT